MTMSTCKFSAIAVLASTAFCASVSPADAVETGLSIYLKGATGFMSGIVPPQPGAYVTSTYYYYDGTADADVRDGKVELGVEAKLNAGLLGGIFVTDWKFLGGQYAFGATIDYLGLDLNATIQTQLGSTPISLGNDGIGDSIVTPIILGWHDGNLHWNTSFSVFAPTGSYAKGALNVGRNVWGFFPQFSMTYFDPKVGLDVSGTLTYVTMTRNDATDYQSGDILHLDWAIGQHFGEKGAWEAGVAGNLVEQIGPDSGPGARLGPFKAESFGLGPAVSYQTALGHVPVNLGVRWEHDLTHRNTFDGDVVSVSATAVF
jgi:hypothetical protein